MPERKTRRTAGAMSRKQSALAISARPSVSVAQIDGSSDTAKHASGKELGSWLGSLRLRPTDEGEEAKEEGGMGATEAVCDGDDD